MESEYDIRTDYDGAILYYKKDTDILHRLNGPAMIWPSGTMAYYFEGALHRMDGPAVIRKYAGEPYWETYWINGQQFSPEEFALREMIYGQ